jgi:hypothetical protein
MKRCQFMQPHQLETFANFLEEHPGFVPLLAGEDAQVYGFEIGGSTLSIAEMERLVAARQQLDGQRAALLPAAAGEDTGA